MFLPFAIETESRQRSGLKFSLGRRNETQNSQTSFRYPEFNFNSDQLLQLYYTIDMFSYITDNIPLNQIITFFYLK